MLFKQLEDIDFMDDVALLSHRHSDLKEKITEMSNEAEKLGLHLNKGKTKVLRVNNTSGDTIKLKGEDLEDMEHFTYLGSVVNKEGGTDKDIFTRIGKATAAFKALNPLWNSQTEISKDKAADLQHKREIGPPVCLRDLAQYKSIHTQATDFPHRCLRRILRIKWFHK